MGSAILAGRRTEDAPTPPRGDEEEAPRSPCMSGVTSPCRIAGRDEKPVDGLEGKDLFVSTLWWGGVGGAAAISCVGWGVARPLSCVGEAPLSSGVCAPQFSTAGLQVATPLLDRAGLEGDVDAWGRGGFEGDEKGEAWAGGEAAGRASAGAAEAAAGSAWFDACREAAASPRVFRVPGEPGAASFSSSTPPSGMLTMLCRTDAAASKCESPKSDERMSLLSPASPKSADAVTLEAIESSSIAPCEIHSVPQPTLQP